MCDRWLDLSKSLQNSFHISRILFRCLLRGLPSFTCVICFILPHCQCSTMVYPRFSYAHVASVNTLLCYYVTKFGVSLSMFGLSFQSYVLFCLELVAWAQLLFGCVLLKSILNFQRQINMISLIPTYLLAKFVLFNVSLSRSSPTEFFTGVACKPETFIN